MRKLYVFEHATSRGKAHLNTLLDTVAVKLNGDLELPTCYEDYDIRVNSELLPLDVKMHIIM